MADFSYLARPYIRDIRRRINSQRLLANGDELRALGDHGVKCQSLLIVGEDAMEIPIRLYFPRTQKPKASVLLFFHGGGFFSGLLATDDATCIRLAMRCGLIVMIDVGIPPEFDLYVMGISAGACLAASIVLQETMLGKPSIKGQCLAAPWLCLPEKFPFEQMLDNKDSPAQCHNSTLLSYPWVLQYARMMNTPESCLDSPLINPLQFDEEVVTQLPPTHIMVCGDDPLRDHGIVLADLRHPQGYQPNFTPIHGMHIISAGSQMLLVARRGTTTSKKAFVG
ncbi:Alpha/Beta hydrolase protein [Thelonectria olida]|uniref:Alpha/Beta hydrolase protein n=1 Tax=Thelonectria olida TaxID=1576542 RepID=A0A9P9AXS1_9HYPO|nr:Alpha/Beta hydrolase protein [Thelonectria olida]